MSSVIWSPASTAVRSSAAGGRPTGRVAHSSPSCTSGSRSTPGSWAASRVRSMPRLAPIPHWATRPIPASPGSPGATPQITGVVLDAQGKIAWGRGDIDGDPIVVVLSEQVSDSHLAGLRRDGVSYIFAGEHELDLALALA